MTSQLTTTQALNSFAGATIFGLSMDVACLVSRHMSDAIWFALREGVGLVFWSVLAGWQSSHAQIFGYSLFFLGCPLDLLHSLGSLARQLGSEV
jgi:hypothetical protein